MGRKSRAKQQGRDAGTDLPAKAAAAPRGDAYFGAELLDWTYRLTGLEPDRVMDAVEKLLSWRLPPIEAEFLRRPSVDTAVASTLLAEGVERLVEHGAQQTQLLAKLRSDPQPWPAWAEIRAGSIFLKVSDDDVGVTLEPGRAEGKQPDYRLVFPKAQHGMNVEFKAVGLSDREADFCRRMCERLPGMVPPVGLLTVHAPPEAKTIRLTAAGLRQGHAEAASLIDHIPNYPAGLSGAIAVAHGSEPHYLRRLRARLEHAIGQLPLEDDGWVAFHWTNGAPVRALLEAIDWDALPERLTGLIVVGDAVVFPRQDIEVFVLTMPRGVGADDEREVDSTLDDELAALMLDRVEASAGIRATVLKGEVGAGRSRELLRRDGRQRILPFNLVLDADPPELGGRDRLPWDK